MLNISLLGLAKKRILVYVMVCILKLLCIRVHYWMLHKVAQKYLIKLCFLNVNLFMDSKTCLKQVCHKKYQADNYEVLLLEPRFKLISKIKLLIHFFENCIMLAFGWSGIVPIVRSLQI